MKIMKKIATLLLTICLVVPCFSVLTHAADGVIQFIDPSTAVGETLELLGVVKKPNGGSLGALDINITMSYDTSMLKFKSGDGVTEETAGTLVYAGTSTSSDGARKEFILTFDVLKKGTTKLEIEESTIKNASGTVLDYSEGSSTITIAEGTGTTVDTPTEQPETEADGATVDVDGVMYTISNTFPESEIPDGYVESTLNYDLVDYNVVYSESSGLYLAYLINEEMLGDFFMYDEEYAVFAPYEEIKVSEDLTIALLSDVSDIVLPEEYVATTVRLYDKVFPAWRHADNPDYYILYAIKNNGERQLYQLDNQEGTYQRFIAPEVVVEEVDDSFIGKLTVALEDHLEYVILGTGIGFILFILIIIVLSVKLYNRNAELDEIYDEYGLDEEDSDDADTEDDIMLDLEDDSDDSYDDDSYDDEDADENADEESMEDVMEDMGIELDLQKDMKEVFADDTPDNLGEVLANDIAEEPEPKREEESLGAVLQKQASEKTESKSEVYEDGDDEDDILGDLSLEFIDLDD